MGLQEQRTSKKKRRKTPTDKSTISDHFVGEKWLGFFEQNCELWGQKQKS